MKIQNFLILAFLCILSIIEIINAQDTGASPKIVTLPGPNVDGIPQATKYPNSDYKIILSYSLLFYEAQRSGRLPKTNRVPWRHDAALDDGRKEGVDLSGGYFDAGDYMKFTLPLSWTLTIISWGGLEWFEGYELSGQVPYLKDMVKWGTDWLINAHPLQTNELFVQVATDKVDHAYWGTDLNIPLPRPAFKVGGDRHGTDVSGEAAAAFASAAIFFKEKFADLEYSNLLLTHAKRIYEFAELKPFQFYSQNVPEVKGLYETVHLEDKLVWGALWIYKATGDITYLNKAIQYFKEFEMKGVNNIINWADNSCATLILFAQLTNGTKAANEWKLESERYLDGMVDSPNSPSPRSKCFYTAGGLLWCNGESEFNSLNVPVNIAFVALAYAPYATTPQKSEKYKKFALSQINYTLGQNPMKMPYIIGVSPNSPQNPHHAGAHGSTTNSLKQPKKTTNIIYGAIVGGPTVKDGFVDDRNSFNNTEVALDYNAAWQGLMAFQVINLKTDETETNNTDSTPSPNTDNTDYPTDNNNTNETDKSNAEQAPEKTDLKSKNDPKIVAIAVCSIIIVLIVLILASWKRATITHWFRSRFGEQNDKFTRLP